ncbi:uroporphyrinogen-III C-methyltransferase [Ferrimonas futtsuensis]|uniref:uroporphyrinogen-III C-methyltransferase n=1 Tax=Ferrimonas futtsuensis TaxID=364764 RepID=UPI00041C4729|nr:uroporphyrinogen-III C-methyltransferase [Ferrimonas futtsuensis]
MTKPGKVYLVGAGPGDPGLLTRRAHELMGLCDVVCYDLLIDAAVLSLVPAGTTMIPVGYRGYCGTSIEYGMHPEVVEQAMAGRSVLRLKAGDPFIFGRATEECRCLQHHGIDYEVVPGISSALGAAAYAGFPLTSNGMASDVTFASGHRASTTIGNWAAMGQSSGTLVLYMGAKKLAQHARELIERGRDPCTPVAVISAATSHKQRMITAELNEIGERIADFGNGDPMLVVMGQVVSLSEELDWRGALPLSGVQVLDCGGDTALVDSLRHQGAVVVQAPQIELSYTLDDAGWQRLLAARELWLDSREAAESLYHLCLEQQLDCRHWHWRLSGTEQACAWMAQQGLFIKQMEKPASEALSITKYASEGLCLRKVRLIEPVYPLVQASTVTVEEEKAFHYLVEHDLLSADALVFSGCYRVRAEEQRLGFRVNESAPQARRVAA